MAEGRTPAIQIGQLNLCMPGSGAAAGHRVANGIAESLAQQALTGLQGQFGALNVRVRLSAGVSEGEMSGAIASAITTALQKGNP